ncbi:hypothetical protein F5X71_20020 [Nocardia brasiliensis]|uniref:Uncharacterized protein n=1 Tax=Nocardia brasiliensis TaxID=37326 RepID=A0A6G9XTN1_NOCBR|nr:hypothetical protein F5X71_20020 [Nocardia brasiliensis]
MDISASFPLDGQPPVLVRQGESLLDDPAASGGLVSGTAASEVPAYMNGTGWACWMITSRSLLEVQSRGWLVRFLPPDVAGSPGFASRLGTGRGFDSTQVRDTQAESRNVACGFFIRNELKGNAVDGRDRG